MTIFRLLVFVLVFFVIQPLASYGQVPKTLKKLGLKNYEAKRYLASKDLFEKYLEEKPNDDEVALKCGISSYFVNELDRALALLEPFAEAEKNPNTEALFYLARTYASTLEFDSSIATFKRLLQELPTDDVNRRMIHDMIRCSANGLVAKYAVSDIIVDQLPAPINTPDDDFKPLLSNTVEDRLYFSSIRKTNLGGLLNADGEPDDEFGVPASDMFVAERKNGVWATAEPMSYLLNSPRHDVALALSPVGDRLYFFKGDQLFSGEIVVDTFQKANDAMVAQGYLEEPIHAWEGDTDPFFFNEQTILFSSNRPGGLGGYDLYVSALRDGQWTAPKNLGPNINSAYDEKSPFLCSDGRTLYYSTNNSRVSIGGFDIVRATFNEVGNQFAEAKRLPIPLNSPGDDTDFQITYDGRQAFFCSSRKLRGIGKRDIFTALLKEPEIKQQIVSTPPSFADLWFGLSLEGQVSEASVSNPSSPPLDQQQPAPQTTDALRGNGQQSERFVVPSLTFTDDGDVLAAPNLRILDSIIVFCREHPELSIVVGAHTDQSEPVPYDLYSSIKRAERVAEYLVQRGVNKSAVFAQGNGGNYPLAENFVDGQPNLIGQAANRRIEIRLIDTDNVDQEIFYPAAVIPDGIARREGIFWRALVDQVVFRVQISATNRLYTGRELSEYPNPFVERQMSKPEYRYLLGLYPTFVEAEQLRSQLVKRGIKDAFIVPYVEGTRRSKLKMASFLLKYTELNNYFKSKNQ